MRPLKVKFWFLMLGMLFFSIFGLPAQNVFSSQIEKIAQDYVKKKKNKGLVIGIVQGDGTEIKGFGKLSNKQALSPDENTLFEIGSITNVFTTSMMMVESQAGKFGLGHRIQEYLPEGVEAPKFHPYLCVEMTLPPNTNDYESNRIISCRPHPYQPDVCITFCDLATHSSGLPNSPKGLYPWNPLHYLAQKKNPYEDYTKEEMYEKLHKYELSNEPGIYFKYSRLGIALLGNIIADLTGQTYGEVLDKTILRPLLMEDTRLELSKQQLSRLAPGHNRKGQVIEHWEYKGMAPAGGLKSSGADMVKFLQANLTTDNLALREAFEQAQQSRLETHQRKLDRPTWIGYGWFVSTLSEATNLPVVWHNGGTGGFRAFIGFTKDSQTGVVLLSNSANSLDEMGFEILELLNTNSLTKQ